MIKASELRLGNLVRNGTSAGCYTVCMIEGSGSIWFTEMDGHSYDLEENDIGGVPLTPDFLKIAGFRQFPPLYYWALNAVDFINDGEDWWLCYENEGSRNLTYYGEPFKFVHQLQNLYFALTGEELTIKEIA